jgi:hypothetical protein
MGEPFLWVHANPRQECLGRFTQLFDTGGGAWRPGTAGGTFRLFCRRMAALVTDITRQEPLQEDSQILGTEIKGCLEIVRQAGHVPGNVDSPSAERQWMIPVRRQQVRDWSRMAKAHPRAEKLS